MAGIPADGQAWLALAAASAIGMGGYGCLSAPWYAGVAVRQLLRRQEPARSPGGPAAADPGTVPCDPGCGAPAGQPCRGKRGRVARHPHGIRRLHANSAQRDQQWAAGLDAAASEALSNLDGRNGER
jgi:hypothetical protein